MHESHEQNGTESKRRMLEGVDPMQLREMRVDIICKISELETDLMIVNDALGLTRYDK